MKNKNHLIRIIAGALVISSFAMCTKSKIEKSASATSNTESVNLQTEAVSTFTYTVKPSEWMVDGTNIPAGATIFIPTGTRGSLLFKNLKGTAAAPITITNQGGKAIISTSVTASYAFKTQNCSYFKVIGKGTSSIKNGLAIIGGNIGMTMDDLSSDFEIAGVEVCNSGFAGIMAKTDPSCNAATWRGHFTMKNVIIHNNYVHKTGGEGFYIGNSFYADGVSLSCGTVLPHDVVNAKIYANFVDSTGSEGIQVGCAVSGCEVYNNMVINPGMNPFSAYQDNGIQIGEGTGGRCYNNLIANAPGNGIIVLGLGNNQVFNNYILNSKSYGIFADSRYTPGLYFQFINNAIISSKLGGIKLNSETIPMNTVINNVIVQSGGASLAIIRKSSSVKLTALNNYITNDVNNIKYVNYNGGDFHLLSSSPLIRAGQNTTAYGVSFDYFSTPRPPVSAFDIGAAKY
ncbi:Right handed beta helix region [Mucilaginibacter sp. OK268]|uniref:right-handed parallel beta-helix repeat-containing protein n=1 Tax=Mucilaginibacter sp. OK268 TaxID=1881048 RepID=UPI000887000B|nr:right-handed parallel beta-helix repeat-containing protein [Mucilaginibacter sp. OK268]SDP29848.1 Right handed beta helix region [Mucilaginibacter sp. OK268]